jgi:hypothetical protein
MISRQSNYQDFIKFIAIITMIIDHLGMYFFPEATFMRAIGRTSMPVFCFFAGYNFGGRLSLKLFLCAVIVEVFSKYFIWQQFFVTTILVTILLGQLYLFLFAKYINNFYSGYIHVVLTASLWIFSFEYIDYGTLGISIMILGYMLKHHCIGNKLAAGLVVTLTLGHALITFQNIFNYYDLGIMSLGLAYLYFLLSKGGFSKPIRVNLLPITRRSLEIFVVHIMLIETIWRYFIIQ